MLSFVNSTQSIKKILNNINEQICRKFLKKVVLCRSITWYNTAVVIINYEKRRLFIDY